MAGYETQGVLVEGRAIFPELQFMSISDEDLVERIGNRFLTLLDVHYNLRDGSNMTVENKKELERTASRLIKDIELYEEELKNRGVE